MISANTNKHPETEEDLANDPYSAGRFDETEQENFENFEEDDDEDPYKLCYPDEIYDTIEGEEGFASVIMNRPPAPIPRSCTTSEPEECKTYISTGSTQTYSTNAPEAHVYHKYVLSLYIFCRFLVQTWNFSYRISFVVSVLNLLNIKHIKDPFDVLKYIFAVFSSKNLLYSESNSKEDRSPQGMG